MVYLLYPMHNRRFGGPGFTSEWICFSCIKNNEASIRSAQNYVPFAAVMKHEARIVILVSTAASLILLKKLAGGGGGGGGGGGDMWDMCQSSIKFVTNNDPSYSRCTRRMILTYLYLNCIVYTADFLITLWRHDMKTLSTLLALIFVMRIDRRLVPSLPKAL